MEIKTEMKLFIENLRSQFEEFDFGLYVNLEYGDIYTFKELQDYIKQEVQIYNHHRLVECQECGVDVDQILIIPNPKRKKQNKNQIERQKFDYGEFNIVYRSSTEDIEKMNLKDIEIRFLFYVSRYITYPDNVIKINEKYPLFTEFESITKMSESSIRRAISSLCKKRNYKT